MDRLPKVDLSASFVNIELIDLNMFGKNITSLTAVDFRFSSNSSECFYEEDAPRISNGSAPKVNFDNFNVSLIQGKIRQINDYYPYGMAIYGLNGDYDDYLNKYTGKEYQTGEFDPSISQGLEMFDFGSRFYDAQLGRHVLSEVEV